MQYVYSITTECCLHTFVACAWQLVGVVRYRLAAASSGTVSTKEGEVTRMMVAAVADGVAVKTTAALLSSRSKAVAGWEKAAEAAGNDAVGQEEEVAVSFAKFH
jgi:hypothetical protein